MLIIQPLGIKAIHVHSITGYIDGMIKIWSCLVSFHILAYLLPGQQNFFLKCMIFQRKNQWGRPIPLRCHKRPQGAVQWAWHVTWLFLFTANRHHCNSIFWGCCWSLNSTVLPLHKISLNICLGLACPSQPLTGPFSSPAGSMLALSFQAEHGGSCRVKIHKQQHPLHGAVAQTPSGCVTSDRWMWSERAGAEHLYSACFRAFLVLNLV